MSPRPSSINDPLSIPLARNLAQSYADMGLAGYNRLANAFQTSESGGPPLSDEVATSAIAAAMALAFAAELFIKVLSFQATCSYPHGHDLEKLVANLPDPTKASFKRRYEELVKLKPNLLHLNFEMFSPDSPPPQTLPVRRGDEFEEAIKLASPLFVKLRYLYEEVTVGFNAEIDFKWLIILIDACRVEIDQFQGPLKVTTNEHPKLDQGSSSGPAEIG